MSERELSEAYKLARVAVVPLRYGAGVKGKVIESVYHGVPVITTQIGAEGLPGEPDSYMCIQDDAQEYAKRTIELLGDQQQCQCLINNADKTLKHYFSRDNAIEAVNQIMGIASE